MISTFKNGVHFSKGERLLGPTHSDSVKDFVEKSSELQNLFAISKGSFARIKTSLSDFKDLKNFIHDSLFSDLELGSSLESQYSERSQLVNNLAMEMITISKRYETPGEVHYSLILVYYYDYKCKTMEVMPLFKVYKKTSGSESMFLDVLLKKYDGWNFYLEHSELPKSFMCVPKYGTYTSRGEQDLMFLFSKRNIANPAFESVKKLEIQPVHRLILPKGFSWQYCWDLLKGAFDYICNLANSNSPSMGKFLLFVFEIAFEVAEKKNPNLINKKTFELIKVGKSLMLANGIREVNESKSDREVSEKVKNFPDHLKTSPINWKAVFDDFFIISDAFMEKAIYMVPISGNITLEVIFWVVFITLKIIKKLKNIKSIACGEKSALEGPPQERI